MSSLITTTIIIIVIIIITCTLPLTKPQVTRDEVCQGAQQQWKTTFLFVLMQKRAVALIADNNYVCMLRSQSLSRQPSFLAHEKPSTVEFFVDEMSRNSSEPLSH